MRKGLVIQHVEMVRRSFLAKHPDVVREYVKGKQGVYALYNGPRLYYVGLASNLRSRLKAHLRDRHARLWDHFSLYLTAGDDHIRELEALVLRITMPRGNKAKTKFAGSADLRRFFRRRIKESQVAELNEMFGSGQEPRGAARRPPDKPQRKSRSPKLAPFLDRRTPIRLTIRGVVHHGVVRPDGSIRYKGTVYNSPSTAAKAITGRAMNGWYWWKYEARPGEWERLQVLRKSGQRAVRRVS
ncbi:MAG TPA: hypothetical protein VFT41_13115 [Gemmatimonadaceae bacterium]|nr:hypothetical protein [Gemmatimonadaceae bacterium]